MALKSTIYKVLLQIADMDRHYYHDHRLTIARHPSETDERMMIRILVFAKHAHEDLAFTKGLSTDDEPDICRMLKRWTSRAGHHVRSVSNGKRAIDLVKKEHYDVIFLDIVMPGISGEEALVKIKEISVKSNVIMITGSLLKKSSWRRFKQYGASGFIQKPFKMQDIIKFLN